MKILNRVLNFLIILFIVFELIFVYNFKQVEAEDMKDNVSVSNATISTIQDGYNETDGIKIDFSEKTSVIKIKNSDIDTLNIFDCVLIEFRVKYDGTGYSNELKLYKAEGDLIDYGYPAGVWNRVRFKSRVYTENNEKFVKFEMDYKANGTVYISDLSVTKCEEDKPLLGGVTLYSLESQTLAMGYVAITPDNKVIVIDGGNVGEVANTLKFLRTFTNKVDYWFITHFHVDHTSVLLRILQNESFSVENLYFDFPTTAQATTLSGDADSYICDALRKAITDYPEKVKNVHTPKKGDEIDIGSYVKVKVLNNAWYDESNSNYGNNTSVMYKMETPGESILFTGDMGDRGDYCLQDAWTKSEVESCTVIQMAHHGQNGVSDNFYNTIKEIKMCLYPAVGWIYDNNGGSGFNTAHLTTLHTRDLMREKGVMNICTTVYGRKIIL